MQSPSRQSKSRLHGRVSDRTYYHPGVIACRYGDCTAPVAPCNDVGVMHCAFTLTPTSFHAGCWHPERGISVGLPSKDCQRIRSSTEIALRRWRHAMTLGWCTAPSPSPQRHSMQGAGTRSVESPWVCQARIVNVYAQVRRLHCAGGAMQ